MQKKCFAYAQRPQRKLTRGDRNSIEVERDSRLRSNAGSLSDRQVGSSHHNPERPEM
jgi:hypothetical protein